MPHPSITFSGESFRRDASNLKRIPQAKEIPGKVRLVKDLLRIGDWPIGVGADGSVQKWNVTPEILDNIEKVFTAQKGEGQTRPLQWGHADPAKGTANVEPEKVIDYWETVWHEGGTLWGEIYVDSAEAERLKKVKRPVSVGVDYLGNVMTPGSVTPVKDALLHVAIVDQGAMPDQGGFVQMAAALRKKPMDFAALVESINALLNAVKPGAKLPEGVDESNINLVLSTTVSLLTGDEAAVGEDPAEDPAVGPVDTAMPPEMAQMAAAITKKFEGQFAQMNAALALLGGQNAAAKKAAFEKYVDDLCGHGIQASARESLINVGKANDWDTSKLGGLPGVDAALIQMGSHLGKHIPESSKDAELKSATQNFIDSGFPAAKAREMAKKTLGIA